MAPAPGVEERGFRVLHTHGFKVALHKPQPDTPPSASSILEHALDELRRCKSTTSRLASHTPKTSESLLATLAYVDTEQLLSSTSQASHVSEDDEEDSSYLKPLSPMQPVGHGGWTGPSMLSRTTGLGLAAEEQAQLLDRVLTSPQLELEVQQAMQQCPTTKQRVACLLLDRVQLLMDSGTCGEKGGQHTDDVTARRVLACLVPPEPLEQQLVSEAAQQNLEQRASIQDRADSLRHFTAVRAPDNRGHQGISQAVFDYIRHYYHEHSKPSPSCKEQRSYWVCQTAGDDERTLVNETRRFFESSLLVMWLEFDDEQQHLEEQWRQNQHQQGGQLQQPPSMRVSLSTFVRLRPPWVARLTASQRQVSTVSRQLAAKDVSSNATAVKGRTRAQSQPSAGN
ncbi:hypothetical protein V8C86DRAFT_3023454 [Haematococcus lacustris]